jgi:hypothetical protein
MYYITTFCAVYTTEAVDWLSNAIANVIVSWGFFQFLGPLSGGFVRELVRCYPSVS